MFDMDSFEMELDAQNAALEAMLADLDDEGSVDMSATESMLAKVQNSVDTKCDTMEACEAMLDGLNVEIAKYNDALRTMKEATEAYKIDGDKVALKEAIAPASESLRATYGLISLEGVNSSAMITDEEIKTMHDFFTGSQKIIHEKMNSLYEATESFSDTVGGYLDQLDSISDPALEAAGDKIIGAAIKVINAVKSLVDKHVRKLQSKGKSEKAQKWAERSQKLADYAKHIQAKHDAKVAFKGKEFAEKTKATLDKEQSAEGESTANEAFNDYFEEQMDIDLAMEEFAEAEAELKSAFEAYTLGNDSDGICESFLNSIEDDIATEGAGADAVATIVSLAVLYGPLIALAVKAGMSNEAKYVRLLQKEFKPKEKELNKKIKAAKRHKNWDEYISLSNQLIKLNKQIVSEVESLGREVNKVYKKNSDGSSSESFQKAFSIKQNEIMEKSKANIENLQAGIVLAKRQKSKANESAVDDAFIEGYTRALEMMADDDAE